MYTTCPKCGHAPLPADQALPAACPACGVILAKIGAAPLRRAAIPREEDTAAQDDRPSLRDRLLADTGSADSLHLWLRLALLAAFTGWAFHLMFLDVRSGAMGASFIHRPLLVFHEAGHVIFRLFGEWMGVFGGTLGQLLMPVVLGGALLLKNRDAFGAALGVWLLGVSLMDVAPYAYDALQPQLTLLSGGTGEDSFHDWIYLLDSVNLRQRAQLVGLAIHKVGVAVTLVGIGWAAAVLKAQHRKIRA